MGSMSNMLRSLLVIGFFLLVLVAIVPRMSEVERPAVDASGKAATVATQTRWPVEMPTGLGSGWVPTTATYAPGTDKVPTFTTVWKTPGAATSPFKQAAAPTDTWLSTSVTDNPAAGTVQRRRAHRREVCRWAHLAGQLRRATRRLGRSHPRRHDQRERGRARGLRRRPRARDSRRLPDLRPAPTTSTAD